MHGPDPHDAAPVTGTVGLIGPADLWYKDAVIYSVNVETFQDSDGDGVGDFPGLTSRLDYLHGLGVTCVWLQPFYPSPGRDNRYDVADYYGVDPRLGTLGDFVDFLRVARERGIRVMIDLVVNHTSDQHPWFQAARRDPDSRYRPYYVWADAPPSNAKEGMVFPGVETSCWTYDDVAGAWYFHRFYRHQPDLDLSHPAVREEIRKIMGFWLELGVSGFRVDAAPFLIERKGVLSDAEERRRPHSFFRYMRGFLSWRRGDAALLAEANVPMDEVVEYVGEGNKLHMLLGFHLNPRLFAALATGEAAPFLDAVRSLAPLPPTSQWANFLRNHDELDLQRLTPALRERVYDAFAPREDMRLYGRGVRRRLAPMLGGDRRRLELAWSLMLALPGTPVLYYGDEIGMGEDLALPERESVRTPMQWSAGANGGFSTAAPEQLVRPAVADGPFGFPCVNVAAQQRDPHSFLAWVQRALRVRQTLPELRWGALQVVELDAPDVVALCTTWRGASLLTLHNLSAERRVVRLGRDEADLLARRTEAFGDRRSERLLSGDGAVALEGYGYLWLRA